MAFSKQEYWSGLPFLPQEIFPTQGSNWGLLYCWQILYLLSHQGRTDMYKNVYLEFRALFSEVSWYGDSQIFFSLCCLPLFPFLLDLECSPFDPIYNLVKRNMKRLGNWGLKVVVFGVTFLPSEWRGTLERVPFTSCRNVSPLKDRELSKSDLAKTMILSGLLPLGRNWLFMEIFQLFLKREGIESSLNCNKNVDLMDGNMIEKLLLNWINNAQRITSAYQGFVPVSFAVVVSCGQANSDTPRSLLRILCKLVHNFALPALLCCALG